MKIDTDLRLAIRSSISHRKDISNDWAERRKREKAAIAALISKRGFGRKIALAKRRMAAAEKLNSAAREVFRSLGVSEDLDHVRDDQAFHKAGGRIDPPIKKLNFDEVMSRLSAASPKEAKNILLKLGINWQ